MSIGSGGRGRVFYTLYLAMIQCMLHGHMACTLWYRDSILFLLDLSPSRKRRREFLSRRVYACCQKWYSISRMDFIPKAPVWSCISREALNPYGTTLLWNKDTKFPLASFDYRWKLVTQPTRMLVFFWWVIYKLSSPINCYVVFLAVQGITPFQKV